VRAECLCRLWRGLDVPDKSNSVVQLKSINESEPHGEDTIHRMLVYTLVIVPLRLSQFF
jgi:hypothetical protein